MSQKRSEKGKNPVFTALTEDDQRLREEEAERQLQKAQEALEEIQKNIDATSKRLAPKDNNLSNFSSSQDPSPPQRPASPQKPAPEQKKATSRPQTPEAGLEKSKSFEIVDQYAIDTTPPKKTLWQHIKYALRGILSLAFLPIMITHRALEYAFRKLGDTRAKRLAILVNTLVWISLAVFLFPYILPALGVFTIAKLGLSIPILGLVIALTSVAPLIFGILDALLSDKSETKDQAPQLKSVSITKAQGKALDKPEIKDETQKIKPAPITERTESQKKVREAQLDKFKANNQYIKDDAAEDDLTDRAAAQFQRQGKRTGTPDPSIVTVTAPSKISKLREEAVKALTGPAVSSTEHAERPASPVSISTSKTSTTAQNPTVKIATVVVEKPASRPGTPVQVPASKPIVNPIAPPPLPPYPPGVGPKVSPEPTVTTKVAFSGEKEKAEMDAAFRNIKDNRPSTPTPTQPQDLKSGPPLLSAHRKEKQAEESKAQDTVVTQQSKSGNLRNLGRLTKNLADGADRIIESLGGETQSVEQNSASKGGYNAGFKYSQEKTPTPTAVSQAKPPVPKKVETAAVVKK